MALDILEWGIIAVMGIAIFIYGPERVPQIAKTIGNARREIDNYTKQFQGITRELTNAAGTGNIDSIMGTLTGFGADPTQAEAAAQQPPAPVAPPMDDAQLIDMAKKLSISTRGKTRDQIQADIVAKASEKPADHVEVTEVQPAQSDASPTAVAPEPSSDAPVPADARPEAPSQTPAAG
ncbi:MAG: twin-arginine translocase TatA/TatE family subunit [Thaumarchaeota archaeon]|nr:twin-arginine translocase TatA/TatE family subunit [Nitrososphaerota archaeon]